jgi:hypothetical protein
MNERQWQSCTDPAAMVEFLRVGGGVGGRKLRLFGCACVRRVWHLLSDDRCRRAAKFASSLGPDRPGRYTADCCRRAVNVAECFADGLASQRQMTQVCHAAESAAFSVPDTDLPAGVSRSYNFDLLATGNAAQAASNVASTFFLSIASARYYVARAVAALAAVAPVVHPGRDSWRKGAIERGELAAHTGLLRDLFGPLPLRSPPAIPSSVRTWNDGTVVCLAQAAYDGRTLPAGTLDNARLAVLADALEEAGCQEAEVLTHLREQSSHWRGCWVLDRLLGNA